MKTWNKNELEEIQNMVNNKFVDTKKKEIGDRVKILDTSSVTGIDIELDPIDYQNLIDGTNEFIVISISEKTIYKSYFKDYFQDLIIVNRKTNIQYRVLSDHVKIL